MFSPPPKTILHRFKASGYYRKASQACKEMGSLSFWKDQDVQGRGWDFTAALS